MAQVTPQEVVQMSTTQGSRSPRNLAARAGRWSAEHRKTAILGWLAFVAIALVLGMGSGMKTIAQEDLGNGESGRADKAQARAFPQDASETVLVQSRTGNARDPEFRAAVGDVVRRVSKAEAVRDVRSPYDRGNRAQLAPDGRSALVEFKIAGDEDQAEKHVVSSLAAVRAAQAAHPQLRIDEFGDASAFKAVSE